MNNNLSYVVTLTAQHTASIKEVMDQLAVLKNFVEQGAEFEIKLGGDAIKNLKKQIRDSIRDTLGELDMGQQPNRGSRKASTSGGGLNSGSDEIIELSAAIRELSRIVTAGDVDRRVGIPGSRKFTSAGGDLDALVNKINRGQSLSSSEVKAVVDALSRATAQLRTLDTSAIKPLIEKAGKLAGGGDPASSEAKALRDLNLKEVITKLSNEQRRLAIAVQESATRVPSSPGKTNSGNIDWKEMGRVFATGIREGLATADDALARAILENREGGGGGGGGAGAFHIRNRPVTDTEANKVMQSHERSAYSELRSLIQQKGVQLDAAKKTADGGRIDELTASIDMLTTALAQTEPERLYSPTQSEPDMQEGYGATARNQARRILQDRNSIAAKTIVQGQLWFDTLASSDRNMVSNASRNDFVAIPGADQREVKKMLTQMLSAPLGFFAAEKNPAEAQRAFSRELVGEIIRLEAYLESNTSEGGAVIPPMVADRLGMTLKEARRAQRRESIDEPEKDYDAPLREAVRNTAWLQGLGDPSSAYRALMGPRNFYAGHGRAREGRAQELMAEEDRPQNGDESLFTWSPMSIQRDLAIGKIDADTYDVRKAAIDSWALQNNMRFFENTVERQSGAEKFMQKINADIAKYSSQEYGYGTTHPEILEGLEKQRRRVGREIMMGGVWADKNSVEDAQKGWATTLPQLLQDETLRLPNPLMRAQIVNGVPQNLTNNQLIALLHKIPAGRMSLGESGVFPRMAPLQEQALGGGEGPPGIAPPNVPGQGGKGGEGMRVYVTNFAEMGTVGYDDKTTLSLTQIVTSLKNTSEMLRKAALVDAGGQAKLAEARSVLGARLDAKSEANEIEKRRIRDTYDLRRQERQQRAREDARRMLDRLRQLEGDNGLQPVDLVNAGPSTGIEAGAYRADQGMFRRDLRSMLGTFRRANQRASGATLERSYAGTVAESIQAEQKFRRAGVDSELSQIQMAQLLLARGGPDGDKLVRDNEAKLTDFLRAAEEAAKIRRIAAEATQSQELIGGLKTDQALKTGQMVAYVRAGNRVMTLEKERKARTEYDNMEELYGTLSNTAKNKNIEYKEVADLPGRLEAVLSAQGTKAEALLAATKVFGASGVELSEGFLAGELEISPSMARRAKQLINLREMAERVRETGQSEDSMKQLQKYAREAGITFGYGNTAENPQGNLNAVNNLLQTQIPEALNNFGGTGGLQFSAKKLIDLADSIAQGRQSAAQVADTQLVGVANKMAQARAANPELLQRDTWMIDEDLKKARRQLRSVFGTEDPAVQAQEFQKVKDEVFKLKTQAREAGTESLKRIHEMAKALGITFTSVDELVQQRLPEVEKRLEELGTVVTRVATEETANGGGGGGGGRGAAGFGENMARKILQLSQYVMAGSVVYSFTNALRGAVRQVVQFEREMSAIQGVLETRSPVQRDAIGRSVVGAALEYGTDFTQSLRAARVYAQIGASPDEIGQLTRATLAAQQGAGFEGAQASEFLIAAKNISGDVVQPFDILDRVSRIEARYAVTSQDLAQSIQRVGSLVTQFQGTSLGGVDAFDTIIGATTAIIEQTRVSGNQASTALRFILSRLASSEVSAELQQNYGIKLGGRTPGELRPMQDILADIATAYKKLQADGDTVRASKLLVTFAGARQANIAAALLGNFGRVQDIASESAYSFGDSNSRAQLQLDTISGRAQQLDTAFIALTESIAQTTGATTVVKKGFEGLAYVLSKWAENSNSNGGMLATAATGTALAFGGRAMAARASAATQTSLTQLTSATGRLALGFGALTLILAGVAASLKLYQYIQDETYGAGSRFRMPEIDTEQANKQYEDQLKDLALDIGTTPTALEQTGLLAARRIQPDFDARFGEGKFDAFMRGQFTDPNITETVNQSLLSTFGQNISSFSSLGTEAERINLAFTALRLAMNGLNIVSEETQREFSAISDTYGEGLKTVTANLDAMFITRDRMVEPMTGTLVPIQRRTRPDEVLESLTKRFRVGGLDLLDDLGGFMSPGGGTVASTMQQLVSQGMETQAALNKTLTESFGVSSIVSNQFWSRFANAREENLRRSGTERSMAGFFGANPQAMSIVGQLNQQRVDAKQAPLTQQEEVALYNQERVYRGAIAQLTERYGGGAGTETGKLQQRNALEETISGLTDPMKQAVRDMVQAMGYDKRDTSVTIIQEMTRLLQNPKTRPSTVADLSSQQSAAAGRLRAQYLAPYIQYIQRQSDITSLKDLNQYGLGYDWQSARAQATQELVQGLGRVRTSMLNTNLQEVIRLGASSRTLYREDFEDWGEGERIVPGIGVQIASLPSRGASGAENRSDGTSLQAALATIALNKRTYEAYAKELQPLINRVEGLPRDVGNIGDQLVEAMNVALSLPAAEAEEAVGAFFRVLVKAARTEKEAREMATRQFAKEQNVLLDRQTTQLRIGRDQFTGQLGIQQQSAMRQIGLEAEAARYTTLGRPDLAYGIQTGSFEARRAELQSTRQLELAILERNLANDPRNLSGRLLSIERQRGTQEIDKTYLSNLQQTGIDEERSIVAERVRRRDAIQTQSRSLIDGVAAPLKSVLSDYETLAKRGIPVVVEGLAQTFQNLFAERAVNALMGADGYLTSGLNSVFTQASFQLDYHINNAFVEGSLLAAQNIRSALAGGSSLPGAVGRASAGMDSVGEALGDRAGDYLSDPGILPGGAGVTLAALELGYNEAGGTSALAKKLRAGTAATRAERSRRLQGGIALAQIGGSLGGGLLGSRVNMGEQTYGQEGGSLGTAVGSAVATMMSATGVGLILGPLVGGLLGGLLGGSQKKRQEKQDPQLVALERIERNTRQQIDAIENQTQLLKPDSRFMNVPAGFLVPGFRPGSAGSFGDININVYGGGQDSRSLADQVAKALKSELNIRGGSFDVRNM